VIVKTGKHFSRELVIGVQSAGSIGIIYPAQLMGQDEKPSIDL
jgi:hypothetical protein